MANSSSELISSINLVAAPSATEQALVSILKKSGNNKRVSKSAREKIELSRVSSDESCHEQSFTDISTQSKAKISRNVACEATRITVSSNSITTKHPKQAIQKKALKPRRRVATVAQRRAANIRERRRMFNLNAAFDRLRKKVPSFAYEKRLSRIETLKLAIMYIRFMDNLVKDDAYAEKYKQLTSGGSNSGVSSSFLSSEAYLSLYGHCGSGIEDGKGGFFKHDHDSPPICSNSPIQLSSSYPNSSSAATCNSVSSSNTTTFVESPNSRSPTAITGQQQVAGSVLSQPIESSSLYYPSQQCGLQTYTHNNQQNQTPKVTRPNFSPNISCHGEQNTRTTLYYNSTNNSLIDTSRKPLDSYFKSQQPIDASISYHTEFYPVLEHHQQHQEQMALDSRQQDQRYDSNQLGNSLRRSQHERVEHYSLSTLEAI